jgi:hypothetical protein
VLECHGRRLDGRRYVTTKSLWFETVFENGRLVNPVVDGFRNFVDSPLDSIADHDGLYFAALVVSRFHGECLGSQLDPRLPLGVTRQLALSSLATLLGGPTTTLASRLCRGDSLFWIATLFVAILDTPNGIFGVGSRHRPYPMDRHIVVSVVLVVEARFRGACGKLADSGKLVVGVAAGVSETILEFEFGRGIFLVGAYERFVFAGSVSIHDRARWMDDSQILVDIFWFLH